MSSDPHAPGEPPSLPDFSGAHASPHAPGPYDMPPAAPAPTPALPPAAEGAPAYTALQQAWTPAGGPPQRGTSPWWVVAIVAAIVVPLVLVVGGVVAAGVVLNRAVEASQDDYDDYYLEDYVIGEVSETATGTVVPGIGTYEQPATIGLHTLEWDDFDGGHLSVTVEQVTWDATGIVAQADPANPSPDPGNVYVQADLRIAYEGPYEVDPYLSLFLTAETPTAYSYADEVWAEPAEPLADAALLQDGEEVTGSVLFELPADEAAGAVVSIEPTWGYALCIAGA